MERTPREGKAKLGPCHVGGVGSIGRMGALSRINGKDGVNEGDERCASFSGLVVLTGLLFSIDEEFDEWAGKRPTVSLCLEGSIFAAVSYPVRGVKLEGEGSDVALSQRKSAST